MEGQQCPTDSPSPPARYSHEGLFPTVGFDASDGVGGGAAQHLRQPGQRGFELQGTRQGGLRASRNARGLKEVPRAHRAPGWASTPSPPSPIPGWRGTSCSSGSWAGICGQSSRAPWPRWTCGTAGTSPSSRRSSVRRADCPERAVRARQSHHQEPRPQNPPTQRHSPDVPHPAVPLLLPAPGTALCTFPGELRSLPRCSLPSARCREGGREKQQHHRCGSSRTLKD